jgi:hypothetical protein
MLEFLRLAPAARKALGAHHVQEIERLRGAILHILYFYLTQCSSAEFLYVGVSLSAS